MMIRLLLVCCIGVAVMVTGSPQFPDPPQVPGDFPMPPMPARVARSAPPPPPEGPPKRVVRQLPPMPQMPEMPTGLIDAQDLASAAAELYGGVRYRREARGGGGHMPTKTG